MGQFQITKERGENEAFFLVYSSGKRKKYESEEERFITMDD